jgi:transketolase
MHLTDNDQKNTQYVRRHLMNKNENIINRSVNTLRFLSADMVQKANSGHPGLPMGCAAIAYTVWTRHLKHNPKNPSWPNRDRFILSGGHGCALLYSLLHLTGYDLPLDELKNFRQWGSKTPGHPEYGLTPGVEVTTGPLGQGFTNGVGMAIAEAHLAAEFNLPGSQIINHHVYAIVTDGDLMEGITSEAASLAGHLKLGKLIYLYDDNRISIDGSTSITFTEDRAKRFTAYQWQVIRVEDGNNVEEVDAAITKAKADPRPSLIVCHTTIGFGLPTRQGTSKAHGEPPGEAELNGAKESLGWPLEPSFYIPDDVQVHFRKAMEIGQTWGAKWMSEVKEYKVANPEKGVELERRLQSKLPNGWQSSIPTFATDTKGMATRVASGKVINALADKIPELIGGSADLAPSTKTWIDGSPAFEPQTLGGRNFHFGVREHAMGGVVNGMAVHGGVIPFGATFLTFADYMREPIRLSAHSHYPSIWVFTHDSIGVGEDGPTHQPVEQLASLRAIPEMTVIRPADANETAVAWKVAVEHRKGPTLLALTRQNVPTLDRTLFASAEGVERGAYVLADMGDGDPELILMASGSEVNLIVEAGMRLAAEAVCVRLVSFPSWELFAEQEKSYQETVLPTMIKARLSVEAGITMGWERWVGEKGISMGVDRFGASAPYEIIYREYGLTIGDIVMRSLQLMREIYRS